MAKPTVRYYIVAIWLRYGYILYGYYVTSCLYSSYLGTPYRQLL